MSNNRGPILNGDTSNTMSMRFGKALKAIRIKSRMTQKQIAECIPKELGVNQSYLSRVENGDLFPGKERVSAICNALGCTISEAWSLAESLDIPDQRTDEECGHQNLLLSCLNHEKLGVEFEDASSIQKYVESRMKDLSDSLDRLHVGLVTYGQIDRRDLDTLKAITKEIVLPAKAAQSIVDLLSAIVERSPEVSVTTMEPW